MPKSLHVAMDHDLYKALSEDAKASDRPISRQARHILKQYYARKEATQLGHVGGAD